MNRDYSIGIVGCGFWANYQVAAWREIPGVKIVSVCDRDSGKMKLLAEKFNIPHLYSDVPEMLKNERLDGVDIISNPETHPEIVLAAAEMGVPVICQKPMALDLTDAKKMVEKCRSHNVPFYIHENFRWQQPMLKVKELLDGGEVGRPFKARIYFNTHFPVLRNQPSLGNMTRMIIADLGVHLFDLVRFFFGEVKTIYCRTQRISPGIKGEDVATVFIETQSSVHCIVELSWASYMENDRFPQTLVSIEGTEGSLDLSADFRLVVINSEGVKEIKVSIPYYDWAHPDYAVVHSSLVPCNKDLLGAITAKSESANRADLNLRTLQLVDAAYQSAGTGNVIHMNDFD